MNIIITKYSIQTILYALLILSISQPGQAITVDQGESIQAAIDKASPGDIIEVRSGTYKEDLILNKPLILHGVDDGNGKPAIIGEGSNNEDLIIFYADGCILRGFIINCQNDNSLTVLSDSNIITDNIITANNECILINESSSNIIKNNTFDINNILHGILLMRSFNNSIKNNTIHFSGLLANGLHLILSSNNTISENNITGNGWLGGSGISCLYSDSNFIFQNMIRTSGLWGSCLYIKDSDNISVSNNDLEHKDLSGNGITLFGVHNTEVKHNKVRSKGSLNCAGIQIRWCEKNHILQNDIGSTGKYGSGIFSICSDYNRLEDNKIENSYCGIYLDTSSDNLIEDNRVDHNDDSDICLYFYCPGNFLRNNDADIKIFFPRNNVIEGNSGRLVTYYEDPLPDQLPILTKSQFVDIIVNISYFIMDLISLP